MFRHGAGPAGPQAYLGGGLLSRDVHRAVLSRRPSRRHLEEQGGLAHARLSREEGDGPCNETAPKDPVQLDDIGRPQRRRRSVHRRDRHGRCRDHAGAHGPRARSGSLLDRSPRLAFAAPADPSLALPSALGAPERGAIPPARPARTAPHGRSRYGRPLTESALVSRVRAPLTVAGGSANDWWPRGEPGLPGGTRGPRETQLDASGIGSTQETLDAVIVRLAGRSR